MKSTHSGRLERFLGTAQVEELSVLMKDWYGPPIALDGVPGEVHVAGGGNFIGECRAGFECSLLDKASDILYRLKRRIAVATREQSRTLNLGFTSLQHLITNAELSGRSQNIPFYKTLPTTAINAGSTAWYSGAVPPAGLTSGAAPAGVVPTNTTTGALPMQNAVSGEILFFAGSKISQSAVPHSMLLYDRLFAVSKTASSTTAEAITGVPNRFASTSSSNREYCAGNFVVPEVFSGLGATAHNWTVCNYTNQAGVAKSFPSAAGVSGQAGNLIDLSPGRWFMPLAAGDSGVASLTQIQCSAAVTGSVEFVIGHPIAWIPSPLASLVVQIEAATTGFSLAYVPNGACLAFMLPVSSNASASTFNGSITLVSG